MRPILFILLLLVQTAQAQKVLPPHQLFGPLFTDVQQSGIFPDSKTFVDAVPKKDPSQIVADYLSLKNNPNVRFSLKLFVTENFHLPAEPQRQYQTKEKDVMAHIHQLWQVLKRKSDTAVEGSSLLPLPNPYIVPGGRFREIYYWDTYFTMLGLKESGEYELMDNMVQNFAYLIDQYGHIPNGNRTYYLSRSQPPFFSLMLELLASVKGDDVFRTYRPALEKEYRYWMDQSANTKHVVPMPDGSVLNRYWDQLDIPRQESHLEDIKTAGLASPETAKAIYRHLRSAAESGWDFSSRWLKDGKTLPTIETTNLIPMDLNCLLHHMETTLARMQALDGNEMAAGSYRMAAQKRKNAINRYCWSASQGWYVDYHIINKQRVASLTLAGMFPFFLQLADTSKFAQAKKVLINRFVKAGGVQTTLVHSGQQWDAPNGWAPLQWVTVSGLEAYGESTLARHIAQRWVAHNLSVFRQTGKLMEKYDVVNTNREAGGGEYPSQDGFGWTNGVLLVLMKKFGFDSNTEMPLVQQRPIKSKKRQRKVQLIN